MGERTILAGGAQWLSAAGADQRASSTQRTRSLLAEPSPEAVCRGLLTGSACCMCACRCTVAVFPLQAELNSNHNTILALRVLISIWASPSKAQGSISSKLGSEAGR